MLGLHHSKATIEKMRKSNWSKGLTKETDPRIRKQAERLIGKHHSEETKRK